VTRRVTADAEGRFGFTELPDGPCRLGAEAEDHVAGGPSAGRPTEVVVSAQRALGGVSLGLDRAARVTGRVLSDEEPVEGATLSVLYIEAPGERQAFSLSPDVTTDGAGRFRLGSLGPGRIQILAEKDEFALAESDEIFLRPGQSVDDVVIRLAGGGDILGQVVDPDGRPVPDARVRLAAKGTRGVRRALSDRGGVFSFTGVAPGPVTLMVSALGYDELRRTDVSVIAGEEIEVRLVLAPQAGFGGVVLSPRREPVGGAAVYVLPVGAELPAGHVPLRPDTYTSDDGRFWIGRAPAGPVELYATHPSWGPSDRAPTPAPGRTVELVLSAGGRLVGSVVGSRGAPVPRFGAWLVSFRPTEGGRTRSGGLPRVEVNDASGLFAFEGLAPGVYDVRIAAPGYPLVVSRSHEVRAGGETNTGPIVLSRGGAVVGRVIDAATGAPVAGASVLPASGGMMGFGGGGPGGVSDEAGIFRLDGLPPERLSLRVQAAGYMTKLASGVEVPEDGEADAGVIALAATGPGGPRMQYSGIGAVLSRTDDAVVIRQTFEGSPSAMSGLEVGTEILRINGYDAADLDLREAVEMIRGEAGSEVMLEVIRPGATYPESVRVQRGEVTTPEQSGRMHPRMPQRGQ
jgi:protocatechuate 3,4-dioxygenase beta subunit